MALRLCRGKKQLGSRVGEKNSRYVMCFGPSEKMHRRGEILQFWLSFCPDVKIYVHLHVVVGGGLGDTL